MNKDTKTKEHKKKKGKCYVSYSFLFRSKNYRLHQKVTKMKLIESADQSLLQTMETPQKLGIISEQPYFTSFIWCCSSEARKKMPKNPKQAVCTLLHIFDQFSKSPRKAHYMQKYFMSLNTEGKDIDQYMMQIGKRKGRKDATRLQETVEKMKGQFSSLRKACASINYSWTKFYQFTHLAKPKKSTHKFVKKLSNDEIKKIQEHMKSDEVTFPLPDCKFTNIRFFHSSMMRSQCMCNMLASTTWKISVSTYYKYRPKNFKLQGRIPYHQSCCKKCQNFDAVVGESNMTGIPRTLADCVDTSFYDYNTFFPQIECIL